MRRWWWIPVLVVVVSACGGGAADVDSGAGAASDLVVESGNGLATLTLAEGSLPEGTSPSDIRLEAATSQDAVEGIPMLRVQLLPHGLVLSEPAVLTIALPDTLSGGFIATHQSGPYVEFIAGDVQADAEGLRFTTAIDHFSYVDIFDSTVQGSMVLSPNPVSPGQVQNADVTLEKVADTVSLLLEGVEGSVKLYTYAVQPLEASGSSVYWAAPGESFRQSDSDAAWDPRVDGQETIVTPSGWEFTASSTCVLPNTTVVRSSTLLNLFIRLLSVGPSTNVDHLRFAEAFTGLEHVVPDPDPDPDNYESDYEFYLGNAEIGNTFQTSSWARTKSEALCTDVSTATSSTLSTLPPVDDEDNVEVKIGQDPRSHMTGITPTSTSDDTLGLVASFAQPWDTVPPSELRSFFIWLSVVGQDCSVEGGWERHEGAISNLGPMPTSIVDDGTLFFDTGCPLEPREPILINTRAGSWALDADQAVFREDVEFAISADTVLASMEGRCLVYDLTNMTPLQGCEQP